MFVYCFFIIVFLISDNNFNIFTSQHYITTFLGKNNIALNDYMLLYVGPGSTLVTVYSDNPLVLPPRVRNSNQRFIHLSLMLQNAEICLLSGVKITLKGRNVRS